MNLHDGSLIRARDISSTSVLCLRWLVLLLSSCALVRLCLSRVADRGNVLDPRSWQMSNVHTASNIWYYNSIQIEFSC